MEKRNYYQEINQHMRRYKVQIVDNKYQEDLVNYEIRKLNVFLGEQFEKLWLYLLILLHGKLEDGQPSYLSATIERVEDDGIRVFNMSYYFLYYILKDLEERKVIYVEGEANDYISAQHYLYEKNRYKTHKIILHIT